MKSIWQVGTSVASLIAVAVLLQCCGGPGQNIQPPPIITTASLPNGTAGTQYSQQVQASGGVGPYRWGLGTGALPHGLQLQQSSTNTATISGTPDTPVQADPFTLKVTDSTNQAASQAYLVSITALPDTLSLSQASLNFNGQLDGIPSTTQSANLTNTGSAAVAINSVVSTGNNSADFTQSNTCPLSLTAGANCAISVTFTPSQPGPRVAAIAITDDTAGSPHQLALNGIGLTSGLNATLSASSLTFPGQAVGTTSAAQILTLTNSGTEILNISNVAATGDFGQTNTCGATLASAASCPINVSFTPSALGDLTGTLSVTDNLSGSPQTVSLDGTGSTTKGTLDGICVGNNAVGQCTSGKATASSCPVGTVATTPVVATFQCSPSGTAQANVDQSRGCQGSSHQGQVIGKCEVQ